MTISIVGGDGVGVDARDEVLVVPEYTSIPVFFVVDVSTSLYEVKKLLRVVVDITVDIDLRIDLSLLDDDRLKCAIRTGQYHTQEHDAHEYLDESKS